MMGHRQVEQAALFYEFSLETHVPTDHRLRSIDRFVELGEVKRELASFYSTSGRRSIDPELMIRNEVTLRSVEMFTEYEPGSYISFVSPTPLLLVVALGDHLTVVDEALAAYERALEPKKLVMLSGGHFDAYVKDFELASTPARDWFVTHLNNRWASIVGSAVALSDMAFELQSETAEGTRAGV